MSQTALKKTSPVLPVGALVKMPFGTSGVVATVRDE